MTSFKKIEKEILDTIKLSIPEELIGKAFVAGGCLLSVYEKVVNNINFPAKDIDLYFSSELEFLETYKIASSLAQDISSITSKKNSISIKFPNYYVYKTLDLVKKDFFKNEEQIINTFDFTICKIAANKELTELTFDRNFIKDVSSRKFTIDYSYIKKLKEQVKNNKFDEFQKELWRVNKYMAKGYKPDSASLRELLKLSKYTISDFTILEDYW